MCSFPAVTVLACSDGRQRGRLVYCFRPCGAPAVTDGLGLRWVFFFLLFQPLGPLSQSFAPRKCASICEVQGEPRQTARRSLQTFKKPTQEEGGINISRRRCRVVTAPTRVGGSFKEKSDTNRCVFVGFLFMFVSFSHSDLWGREVFRDVWLTRHADVAAMQ